MFWDTAVARTHLQVPVLQLCECVSPNADCVHPEKHALSMYAVKVCVQPLHPNRHKWDCLYVDAWNTCASHAAKDSPLFRCMDCSAHVNVFFKCNWVYTKTWPGISLYHSPCIPGLECEKEQYRALIWRQHAKRKAEWQRDVINVLLFFSLSRTTWALIGSELSVSHGTEDI